MILRCDSRQERDLLHALSPIVHEGVELSFDGPDETSNRFYRVPPWIAYVAVVDFPNEHWTTGTRARLRNALRVSVRLLR